ncbi:MAG: ATPase [Ruminococcaceae bacterium]|nr:ATPase [Oscillospiraceae bacterium]
MKEGMPMKRLKNKILSMEPNTTTYKAMYEGSMTIIDPASTMPAYVDYSSTYYNESIGFDISTTHKLAQDKPTVVISIPCATLGIDIPDKSTENVEADFCLRAFKKYIDELNAELYNRSRPDNENGKYYLCTPGGEIIKRNTAYFALCPQKDYTNGSGSTVYLLNDGVSRPPLMCLCIRIQVQFPLKRLRKTFQMMCRDLPDAVDRFVLDFDIEGLKKASELAKKQSAIREWLKNSDYCAFLANGSILPRAKGTDLPMLDAIPFRSTTDDEIEICGVRGMGIKKGVTVITGGGYSGKSTLLDAISAGIYDHAIGDGRELCITDVSAVTISAEDGRSVKHVNISPFIKWLPGGDTSDFSTDHASGSTSQASNIMEAVDSNAKLLLIDEDRSATNFMIRDRMMKELIEKEPITPFTDRVNELFKTHGVSTILVIGGSGEYLSVADKIYMMEDYLIHDVTDKSKNICSSYNVTTALPASANWQQCRTLYSDRFSSYPEGSGTEKLEVSDMGFVIIGDEKIDVRGLHDIVSPRQLDTLGFMLRYLEVSNNDREIDIEKKINDLYARIDEEGIDFLYSSFFTTCERFLDLPRKQELMALVNRMRKINMVKGGGVI